MKHRLSVILGLLAGSVLLGFAATTIAQDDSISVDALRDTMSTEEGAEAAFTPDEEVTVGELQSFLNLPLTVRIKEYQEDLENPPSIFDDEATIQRIFGTKPRFIYYPDGIDPMIIPWVRERIIAEELFQEASVATANRDYDKALDILRSIREQYPETETSEDVPAEIARVETLKIQSIDTRNPGFVTPTPGGTVPEAPQLPEWVKINTTGVLIDATPVVVVGNDFLRVGDPVPRYPSVRVKSIAPSEVVYVYQNKEFNIVVEGTF